MKNPPNEMESFERACAYISGDLSSEEIQSFEREMENDSTLRKLVEEARQVIVETRGWLQSEPPGLEQVEALAMPRPSSVPRRSVFPTWRRFATAAVFIIGFFLGGFAQKEASMMDRFGTLFTAPGVSNPSETGDQSSGISGESIQHDTPLQPSKDSTIKSYPADRSPIHHAREENGRLIIETACAVWVVDGNFDLDHKHNEKE